MRLVAESVIAYPLAPGAPVADRRPGDARVRETAFDLRLGALLVGELGYGGSMRVGLRYFDGCPSWRVAEDRLRQVLKELGHPEVSIVLERVETLERAQEVRFRGSPTVLIDGEDPLLDEDAPVGLACRLYRTEEGTEGSPSLGQLREALGA